MSRGNAVIVKAEVLLEVALAYVVHVHADCALALERPVQPFRADAAEHLLEIASVNAVVLLVRQPSHVRDLEDRHRETRGRQVLAHVGAHVRQIARAPGLEPVVVVDQPQPPLRPDPGVVADPEARALGRGDLVEHESVGPTERVDEIGAQAGLEARSPLLEQLGSARRRLRGTGYHCLQPLVRRHRPRLLRCPRIAVDDMLREIDAAPAVDQREAIDLGRRVAVEHRRRPVDALAPIGGFGVEQRDAQVPPRLLDASDPPSRLSRDLLARRAPVRAFRRTQRVRHARRIVQLRHVGFIELAVEGKADHQPVAALDPGGEIEPARGAIGQSEIPWRAPWLVICERLMLIVVGVALELEQQWLPWGLVLHAAEESGPAPEVPA